MNLKEVHRVLNDFFHKELTNGRKRHIVFWYDEEGEFVDDIEEINIPNVRIWEVTPNNLFATKYELEKNDPTTHFLLYGKMAKPNPREDWLLDIYKVAFEFATDKTTVTMRELGIHDDSLRETFKSYKVFFNNKARFQAFTRFLIDTYTEESIDMAVLATLSKSKTNSMDEVVKSLMHDFLHKDLKSWEAIQKYGSIDVFWNLVEKYYGYTLPEKSLQSLMIYFMLTYVSEQNQTLEFPETWKKYTTERPTNVVVFMNQWMNHRDDGSVYNQLADQVEEIVKVGNYLSTWDVAEIIQLDAFRTFDENIIDYIVEQLTNDLTDFEEYEEMISTRRKLHWYPEYKHEYEAMAHAVYMLRLIHEKNDFIPEQSAYSLFQTYTEEFYKMDTAYRKFYVSYDQLEEKDRLHTLRALIENIYSNHFMDQLSVKWSSSLERVEGVGWPVTGVSQQNDFYRNWVHPYVVDNERVFVIISDALRYEVAQELMQVLNNERKASTGIAAVQSVLPSYTSLGMAALLPYKNMAYTKDAKVFVDDISTSGTENRDQILQQAIPEAVAIQYSDVIGMSRTMFREAFNGKKVVYIYHNAIDARGDNASTEMEVFQAAEEAISDIRTLINQLVNNVSASNILITADHGFLYQRDELTTSQKLPQGKVDATVTKRRFMLSETPPAIEGTLTYPMGDLLQQDNELYVTVPKGLNRFAIQGAGANFVHGGAMLQEVVVPVITFKNDRSKSSINIAKKVDVKLTSPARKVTNTITHLEFLQIERIAVKKLPLHLKLYFVDENGERVSNENIIIADSDSSQPGERTFREKFIFKSIEYDKRKTYYLILEDETEQVESQYERYPFTIDIAFSDKYGF
ncbi:BREX-1 system phosphatase PglZ type A [Oceanobacillus manasiensis]|uniref:BREX-1 system phosphatase PglZ type A n=1 Tax=Oceanobacillus manasiensis TaxID=586413 RepID=UPI0005AAB23B|nr:BREX-1 system phosphatase PglZ type A [Oceanobacillus manasiensis]